MEYQALPAVDVSMAATGDVVVADLLAALGPAPQGPVEGARAPRSPRPRDGRASPWSRSPSTLRAEFNDPENVDASARSAAAGRSTSGRSSNGLAYLGKDGGGGLGSGPGLSVGAALALQRRGRHAISMLGDGDFCMGVTAIWTAVRHRIPLLVLVNNNRSYFNDELHQETVARTRGREVEEPLDRAAHGGSRARHRQARRGAGRGRDRAGQERAAEVKAAIAKGVAVLKSGGVCVIDFHVDPPAERSDGIGHRPTGG